MAPPSSSAAVRKLKPAPSAAATTSSKPVIKKPAPAAAVVSSISKPIKKSSSTAPRPSSSLQKRRAAGGGGCEEVFTAAQARAAVHPTRLLSCRTAVVVRTARAKEIAQKLWLVMWLPARVVAAGATHYVVKYDAELDNARFAGKIVRIPVEHVRPAPSWAFSLHCRRPAAAALPAAADCK